MIDHLQIGKNPANTFRNDNVDVSITSCVQGEETQLSA